MSQVLFFFGTSSNFAHAMIYVMKAKLAPLPHERRERG